MASGWYLFIFPFFLMVVEFHCIQGHRAGAVADGSPVHGGHQPYLCSCAEDECLVGRLQVLRRGVEFTCLDAVHGEEAQRQVPCDSTQCAGRGGVYATPFLAVMRLARLASALCSLGSSIMAYWAPAASALESIRSRRLPVFIWAGCCRAPPGGGYPRRLA